MSETNVWHQGHLEVVLVDGARSTSNNVLGPLVTVLDDAGNYTGEDVQYSDDQVVAWQLRCECASATSTRRELWDGPTFARAATPVLEDLEERRIYAAPGDARYVSEREDVDELVRSIWRAEHLAPIEALEEISRRRDEIRVATEKLTEAVAVARASGRSWDDVGRAAGMSRQAAHERWG